MGGEENFKVTVYKAVGGGLILWEGKRTLKLLYIKLWEEV